MQHSRIDTLCAIEREITANCRKRFFDPTFIAVN
jgi:hypothetical protein